MSQRDAPRWRRYVRFWRANVRADVDDEFEFHLEEAIDDLVARGMSARQAREEALRRFGDIEHTKQLCLELAQRQEDDMRRSEAIDRLRQDVAYALRTLRSNVAFTGAITLTLALGIGATTAIFSVVNAVLLKPLPYADADRIVNVHELFNGGRGNASVGHFFDWKEQSQSFTAMAAWRQRTFNLTDGEPTRLFGAQVTPDFFRVLYLKPALGRYFLPDETDASRVTVLSYPIWQSQFAGDPSIVGKQITLNGEKHTVVGVTPAAFTLTRFDERLWVPLTFAPELRTNYGAHTYLVFAKLMPGATLAQALRELTRITEDIRRRNPENMRDRSVGAIGFRELVIGNFDTQLWVLLGAVAFVLLIGCGNVASLLLARATARRKEIAIRGALGGGRSRLVRQLLTESLVLALIGGAAGVGVAYFGVRFLKNMGPASLPRLGEAGLQWDVLLFAFVASVTCGVLFGLAPALRATRVDLQSELREGGRGSAGVVRDRTRAALIVAEFATALVLLVGAGLFLRSAQRLQRVPLGFAPDNVTMMRVALPADRYAAAPTVQDAYTRIVDQVGRIPGVELAAAGTRVPMWGGSIDIGVRVDGRPREERQNLGHVRLVTPKFIESLRIPVLRGRPLRESDVVAGAPWVVVVNETFARNIFGKENPIGHRISGWTVSDSVEEWREIVGVVGDVRSFGQAQDMPPEIYIPLSQAPAGAWNAFQRAMTVVARARAGAVVAPSMRSAVKSIDPQLPVYDVQTMDAVLSQSTGTRRFNTMLLTMLGLTGLVLAAVGIYGVIAFFVTQRTHEIGIRVALGASTQRVVRMVVGQALLLALAGVVIGGALAAWATRVLQSMLFEVGARDPVAYVAAAVVLLAVSVAAAWLPARKASRVDPIKALAGA
jgi:putative ABC transport system permease protein